MSEKEGEEYRFTCPACAERLSVNGRMRDALISNGCVMCGADLTETAFTRRREPPD